MAPFFSSSCLKSPIFLISSVSSKLKVIVPGIRSETDNNNDQKRTLSAKKAIEFGADVIVVGRPITSADSPGKAAEIFHQSIT